VVSRHLRSGICERNNSGSPYVGLSFPAAQDPEFRARTISDRSCVAHRVDNRGKIDYAYADGLAKLGRLRYARMRQHQKITPQSLVSAGFWPPSLQHNPIRPDNDGESRSHAAAPPAMPCQHLNLPRPEWRSPLDQLQRRIYPGQTQYSNAYPFFILLYDPILLFPGSQPLCRLASA